MAYSGLGEAIGNALLDHAFGGGDWTRDATLYLALLTARHTSFGGGGTEVTTANWTNYARLAIDNSDTSTVWAAADAFQKWNASDIEFGEASVTGTGPTITAWALMSASTGGAIRAYGEFPESRQVKNFDVVRFAVGRIQIQFTNAAT